VTLIACALFVLQQFSGINAVVYFSTTVFRKAGVASDIAASALVGAANVFGTVVASALMDSQGRKKLLRSSFLGQVCAMLFTSRNVEVACL
jgi:Na+/melibiose symporter-like transporter